MFRALSILAISVALLLGLIARDANATPSGTRNAVAVAAAALMPHVVPTAMPDWPPGPLAGLSVPACGKPDDPDGDPNTSDYEHAVPACHDPASGGDDDDEPDTA